MFPGDVLLQVFDFCRLEASESRDEHNYNWWCRLVHICQKWRQLIFTSPRRLDLQLFCTRKTPVRGILDFWPNIPIAINVKGWRSLNPTEDNLLAAFEYSDRVWSVTLSLTQSQVEKVVEMMMKPFPALTNLRVKSFDTSNPWPWYLPHGFLGGSTSGLRELDLSGISPLTLPSILSSSTDLVDLHLHNLHMTDDVSPEVMVASLAGMTKLKSLTIEFRYCLILPPNSMAQVILPTLTHFRFRGSHGYLEDLVAQLNTPQLFDLTVMFLVTSTMLHDPVQQLPQLLQFIDHAENLKLSQFRHAHAEIHDVHSFIHFDNAQTGQNPAYLTLGEVKYDEFHSNEFWPMGPLLSQVSAFISTVLHLSISPFHQQIIQDNYWHHAGLLMLLHSFDTVKTLHVGGQFTNIVPPLLNGLCDEVVTKVLPALCLLNFEGKPLKLVKELLAPFIEKRQSNGCPSLTIVRTHNVFKRLQAHIETDSDGG